MIFAETQPSDFFNNHILILFHFNKVFVARVMKYFLVLTDSYLYEYLKKKKKKDSLIQTEVHFKYIEKHAIT